MPDPALRSLRIRGFRGAGQPSLIEFQRQDALTLVYGPNGSGKTTICDAFDFLGNGRVGSLENRGLGGATHSYVGNIARPGEAAEVALEFVDGTSYVTTVSGSKPVHCPPDRTISVAVLRRSQLVALLESTPSKRYEAIERFIDVAPVEKAERALRDLTRSLAAELHDAATRAAVCEAALETEWAQAGEPPMGAQAWAEEQARIDVRQSDREAATLGRLVAGLTGLLDHVAQEADRSQDRKGAKDALEAAQSAEQVARDEATGDAADFLGVLSATQRFLADQSDPRVCPLCESPENAAGLKERVDTRLAAFEELSAAQAATARARQAVEDQARAVAAAGDRYRRDRATFLGIEFADGWPSGIEPVSSDPPDSLESLERWAQTHRGLEAGWLDAKKEREVTSAGVRFLRNQLKDRDRNRARHHDAKRLAAVADRAHDLAVRTRQGFTNAILHDISARVCEHYEAIHPGERINLVSIALDPSKRASLELSTRLQDADVPPQAYYSESHLDTLGLCIFLALAEREAPQDKVLVLDDVIASVDEQHVDRVVGLLYERGKSFRHCVMTTHYRPWKEKIGWGLLRDKHCGLIELEAVDRGDAPRTTRSTPEIERLRRVLESDDFDEQVACSKAGVILEMCLDRLTRLYECSVKRKPDGRHTLGDLLPQVCKKKLKQALVVEVVQAVEGTRFGVGEHPLAPILDRLDKLNGVRNTSGCHFNEIASQLSGADARFFAAAVLDLADLLICPEAGWPRSNKSGSYWSTPGDTRRLKPLQHPG